MAKVTCMVLLIIMANPYISCVGNSAIASDGRFVRLDTGVVKDTKTSLEWTIGPEEPTSWYMAKSWVKDLAVDGGGWRMPNKAEMKTLYQKGIGPRNMNPLLKTTGWWIWSVGDRNSSTAWGFSLKHNYSDWLPKTKSVDSRAFAVRSLADKAKFLSQANTMLKEEIVAIENKWKKALQWKTDEYQKLKDIFNSSQNTIQMLTEEKESLKLSQRNRFIIIGVLFFLVGLIGGFFVGRQQKK